MSLAGMGFDSKCDFTPPTILLGLLPCPWVWGIFLVGSNILLLTVVQQQFAILEFSQEKMSTYPSTPPSCSQTFIGSITTNKPSGGDGIPAELFQIQQDDTDTVLPSVRQQVELSASWKKGKIFKVSFKVSSLDNCVERKSGIVLIMLSLKCL